MHDTRPDYAGSRPRLGLKSPPGKKPFKPKRWSHQDDLRALVGKEVALVMEGDSVVQGILVEADQFTVKVRHTDEAGLRALDAMRLSHVSVYFKSAMIGFTEKLPAS